MNRTRLLNLQCVFSAKRVVMLMTKSWTLASKTSVQVCASKMILELMKTSWVHGVSILQELVETQTSACRHALWDATTGLTKKMIDA